jgi:hypothetical protein
MGDQNSWSYFKDIADMKNVISSQALFRRLLIHLLIFMSRHEKQTAKETKK